MLESPTTVASTNVVIGFTGGGVPATGKTLALVVRPVITTASLPDGTAGTAYSLTLAGTAGGSWTAAPLPAGLTLNPSTGAITGTPTTAGSTSVVVGHLVNGIAATTSTLTLDVQPAITTTSLPDGTVGTAYSKTLAATGGTGTWTASPLPNGLTLDPATGVISGNPTGAGTTNVVIGFSSGGQAAAPKTLALAVHPVISTTVLPDGTRTLAYTVTLAATGTGTWTAAPLPNGLTLNPTTGVISGTPTTVSTTNVVIGFTRNGVAATPKTLSLQVLQAATPVITTSSLTATTVSTAGYSVTLAASGSGSTAGTWTAAPLPAGLTLNPGTGVISGTPTASGTTSVTLGFTQASTGLSAVPKDLDLLVNASISTATLPDGTRTLAYPSTTVHAVGDPAGTWTADNLPPGLSISSAGVISGTPSAVVTNTVTLRFTQSGNGGAPQVTRNVTLKVNEAAAPTITTTSLNGGVVGTAYSTTDLAATGPGDDTGTWAAAPLPAGLSLNPVTGAITGTPTTAGTTNVDIDFTQTSTGLTASKTLALVVKPVITTAALPDATAGTPYSFFLDGSGTGSWTATPRPNGLSINATTGEISGTPNVPGTTSVVIGYTVNGVAATSKTLTLTVKPVISTSSLGTGTVGSAYSVTLNGTGTGTWTAAPLPNGLTLAPATGAITGTPTDAGTTSVLIGYTVNGVAADPISLDLAVRPVISTASLPSGTRTQAYSFTLAATGGTGTWTASPLPGGLSLNPSTGAITGIPSTVGTTNVVIGFTSDGVAATGKTLTLQIVEAPAPTISTTSLPDAQRMVGYSADVDATGNPPGAWSSTGLPTGLTLSPTTGAITGTPTDAADVGDNVVAFTFTQTSTGLPVTKNITLHVDEADPPVITTASLPDGSVGNSYNKTAQANGPGNDAGTWSATGLPPGLDIDPDSGQISGTPTTADVYNVTLNFTQTSTGLAAAPQNLTLTITE